MINREVEKIVSLARDKYTVHDCSECTYRKCCDLNSNGFDSAECLSRRESISLMLGIEDSYFTKLLDDIEAAWKREAAEIEVNAAPLPAVLLTTKAKIVNGGNAAAMREALEMARDALKSAEKYVYGDPPDGGAIGWDDVWPSEWHNALEAVERAISAPARNCDVMSRSMCTKHFSTTYEGNRDGLCDVQTEREKNIHLYYKELIDWLFATAAELKGEGDGK